MLRRSLLLLPFAPPALAQTRLEAVTPESEAGRALVARLRRGGLVLFFRHADTRGEPCDRSFRVGDRPGQRNISEAGRAQARRVGERIRDLGIPVALPVLAGPVFRARDTAEEAFGAGNVVVTDGLLADDYAGDRLGLGARPAPAPLQRARPGGREPRPGRPPHARDHRRGRGGVGGRAFPEGTALVVAPGGDGFRVLGILALAPLVGDGFHGC